LSKKSKWVTVFRAKRVSKECPRIGTPTDIQPGDWLTYWATNGGAQSREVDTIHKGHVVTKPLESEYGVLDTAHKIQFDACHEVIRRADPLPTPAKPEPVSPAKKEPKKPKRPPAGQPPKLDIRPAKKSKKVDKPSKPKRKKRPRKKPPAHLLDFLDGKYSEDD